MLFGGKRPLLCGGYALLSRHELCRIYVLFWSGFDADFYADIEDFVQILCRFLHKKMLGGSSVVTCNFLVQSLGIIVPTIPQQEHFDIYTLMGLRESQVTVLAL